MHYVLSGSDPASKACIQRMANFNDVKVILKSLDAVDSPDGGERKTIDEKDALAVFEMLETCVSDDTAGEQVQEVLVSVDGDELLQAAMEVHSGNENIQEIGQRIRAKCHKLLRRIQEKTMELKRKAEQALSPQVVQARVDQQQQRRAKEVLSLSIPFVGCSI